MIRIAIVDDHATVRQSLAEYLGRCPGLEVVGQGRNGAQALALALKRAPDVLLMDLAMPGQNGLDALAAIRSRAPRVGVLILSGYPGELYAQALVQRGAAGYLHKNCAPEDIVAAIEAVAAGRLVVPEGEPSAWCDWPPPARQAEGAAA